MSEPTESTAEPEEAAEEPVPKLEQEEAEPVVPVVPEPTTMTTAPATFAAAMSMKTILLATARWQFGRVTASMIMNIDQPEAHTHPRR